MRYEYWPRGPWIGPATNHPASSYRFRAPWKSTLDLLGRETAQRTAEDRRANRLCALAAVVAVAVGVTAPLTVASCDRPDPGSAPAPAVTTVVPADGWFPGGGR